MAMLIRLIKRSRYPGRRAVSLIIYYLPNLTSECRSSGIRGGVVLNSIIDRQAWIPRASAFNVFLPERPPTILHRITYGPTGLTAISGSRESGEKSGGPRCRGALIKGTYCH